MRCNQIRIRTIFFLSVFICTTILFAGTIDFQIVASGGYAGIASCGKNHVIESESAFAAFCDSINMNPQLLSYIPNYDSVQVIGIVYEQSTIQAWHSISNIHNGDTIWIEITYSIPSIPDGLIPQPGYKYQIVAIPKQSNPIAFRLVQSTNVIYQNTAIRQQVSNDNHGLNHAYDLLGRQILNASIRNSSGFKIMCNEPKTFKTKPSMFGMN